MTKIRNKLKGLKEILLVLAKQTMQFVLYPIVIRMLRNYPWAIAVMFVVLALL